jgi:hypothetical protein
MDKLRVEPIEAPILPSEPAPGHPSNWKDPRVRRPLKRLILPIGFVNDYCGSGQWKSGRLARSRHAWRNFAYRRRGGQTHPSKVSAVAQPGRIDAHIPQEPVVQPRQVAIERGPAAPGPEQPQKAAQGFLFRRENARASLLREVHGRSGWASGLKTVDAAVNSTGCARNDGSAKIEL